MRFLKRLFGRTEPRIILPKGAVVYHGKRGLFIAAKHASTTGLSCGGEPMIMLSISAPAEVISDHVARAVEASRNDWGEEDWKQVESAFLRFAGANDWDALERRWQFIPVTVEPTTGMLIIAPMHQHEAGGYVGLKGDPEYRCKINEIGEVVRRILDRGSLRSIRDIPSHT